VSALGVRVRAWVAWPVAWPHLAAALGLLQTRVELLAALLGLRRPRLSFSEQTVRSARLTSCSILACTCETLSLVAFALLATDSWAAWRTQR
jgi:hypothetical protein